MGSGLVHHIERWFYESPGWIKWFAVVAGLNVLSLLFLISWDLQRTISDFSTPTFYDIDRSLISYTIVFFQMLFLWHTMVKHNYYELWAIFGNQILLTTLIFFKTFFRYRHNRPLGQYHTFTQIFSSISRFF